MCFKPRSFSCLCCTICILFMFILMLSFNIFWIIIFTSSVKFHITDATLTKLNLTTNNTLYYNLKANITVRNSNNNIIVYYRRITAFISYKDNKFGWVRLTPFNQGHNNTTFLLGPVVFEGNSVMKLKRQQLDEYIEETRVGIYNDVAVDLAFRITPKYGKFKSDYLFNPPIVQCRRLRVPLINSNNGQKSATPFNDTKCSYGYFFSYRLADA